ncbi:MAG: ABC-F family ATP-binding cassette domain-containing protein [Anaerolineae bacterium]
MIQLNNVFKSYQGKCLIDGISFTINRKEKCALVGRNGAGKTTLFRLLLQEEQADDGEIIISKGYRLGALKQHIELQKTSLLEEAMTVVLEEDLAYKAEAILFGLGFKKEEMSRNPEELSGGYQLRLQLAKLLLSEPHCLLLDEPTNYLDLPSIRWLRNFLQSWTGECVIISHDRQFLDSVSTHTIGIHRQKAHKIKGGCREFFEMVYRQEEAYERARTKIEKERDHLESYIRRFGAKASKASQAQSRAKALNRLEDPGKLPVLEELQFDFNEASFNGKRLLSLKQLNFSYRTDLKLIEAIDLDIEKGDRIALIGKNGCGKTTLLRLLSGEIKAQGGQRIVSDHVAIGYFGQTNIDRLSHLMTIEEEISSANRELNQTDVRQIAGCMMFGGDLAKKKISVLSGGERSRVLLGKIIASSSNLLLLDEPTNHLDMESIEALLEALLRFEGACVIVTHSEELLSRIPFNKLVICQSQGQEVVLGTYLDFLQKEGWNEGESTAFSTKNEISSRNDHRQKKAQLVAEKSRTLRPLIQSLDEIEKSLVEKEKEMKRMSQQLLDAYDVKDHRKSQELSIMMGRTQKEIDHLYIAYEQASSHLEEAKRFYEEALDKLSYPKLGLKK